MLAFSSMLQHSLNESLAWMFVLLLFVHYIGSFYIYVFFYSMLCGIVLRYLLIYAHKTLNLMINLHFKLDKDFAATTMHISEKKILKCV